MERNLDSLLTTKGLKPVDLASRALCSADTVDRARKGAVPLPAILAAMATVLREPVAVVRDAILAGKPRKAKAAR